ncbi:MAG TPA: histidinol-phosphatase [Candidatus Bathyarchaeia archaeon]|nr:histidinol-phosphatase [Candidatus Bathyarchaeia archaeon]
MATAGGETFGRAPWAVSLHGGHSGEFCDHGRGTLREIVDAAIARGYHTFGVTEHGPRFHERYLYPEEAAMEWDIEKVQRDFEAYARESAELVKKHEKMGHPPQRALRSATGGVPTFCLLRGFEAEVVPPGDYAGLMNDIRKRHKFDYVVGSVHWVNDVITDHSKAKFDKAAAKCGGQEALAVKYYEQMAEMAEALRPEVVGHLDVLRKYASPREAVETPRARDAARAALEAICEHGCILDINTGGLRHGLRSPYPAPWLLRMAVHEFGIGVCFGDDSHSPEDVGAGILETRQYLIDNGVEHITYLAREGTAIVRRTASLL